MGNINFFNENIRFRLYHKNKIRKWINYVLQSENIKIPVNIDFIFSTDQFLLKINQAYLSHNTFTDVISFELSENNNVVEGEVYISIERVRENCIIFGSSFQNELNRVILHGVLHLIGYDDKGESERQKMHELENKYLNILKI
jgi:probable rRNA maturation factor